MEDVNFLLVDAKVLPDVFLKVVDAKMLLAQGKAKSSSQGGTDGRYIAQCIL